MGKIKLNFTSDIQAGETGRNCGLRGNPGQWESSIESVDIVIRGRHLWAGTSQRWRYGFSADSDYYFKKSGKSAFQFPAIRSSMYPVPLRMIREEMVLVVRLISWMRMMRT